MTDHSQIPRGLPLAASSLAVTPYGLATSGIAALPTGGCPCRGCPYKGPWLQPIGPTNGQVVAGHTYRGPGRGQPPLHADSMQLSAPRSKAGPTFVVNRCNK
ncbi:hypothetical protein B296_00003464 [Ensete ventricosum]|uniref:Uncharacterized protein n=1 Tax=Ensete ventricosum TaxID=4639 RepID=A0A427ASN3_ENSVE|nr:hypothetical protein B296_00003464 [Ensete ventricosum]